jgi:hypothetical protein
MLAGDNWEYQLWRMLNEDRSRVVHIGHVCIPDNGSPGSTFQPEIVLATNRDQPAFLICPNGVFEKEASFPSGDPAPNSDVSVYHRVRTGDAFSSLLKGATLPFVKLMLWADR